MRTGRVCLWSRITREVRTSVSLVPLFVLALFLTLLLPSGNALSFFQSPNSPIPPIETLLPLELSPTVSPTPQESAAPTTLSPTEVVDTLIPTPTEVVVVMPAVQVGGATALISEVPPLKGGTSLWPWMLLGFFSLGAIAAGVFLVRREPPDGEDKEEG